MSEYEVAYDEMTRLVAWAADHPDNRNEATVRLHLINALVYDCLSWPRSDVTAEDPNEEGFADYGFYAGRRIMLLEAKKGGEHFIIPAGIRGPVIPISSICRANAPLKKAMQQVMRYANALGVGLAVVCNGHQWLAFLAGRTDGVPPLEGNCLVFPSLDSIQSQFDLFWNCFSQAGQTRGDAFQTLISSAPVQLPSKPSQTIRAYPRAKPRSETQADFQRLSDLIIDDIHDLSEDEAQFLRECYCKPGALSQSSALSRRILEHRYAELTDPTTSSIRLSSATDPKSKAAPEMLTELRSRRPILLLGDVGAGKSAFIKNLILIDAETIARDAVIIYIDLGSQATISTDLRDFVCDEIARQLLDKYEIDIHEDKFVRALYHSKLKEFARGIHGPLREINPSRYAENEIEFLHDLVSKRAAHVGRAITHIAKGRNRLVILVLDNADQRDMATQQAVFLIAQEVAQRWPATVFVALRPSTYNESKRIGTLSGYNTTAFYIAPPRPDQVLKKRAEYAVKLATGHRRLRVLNSVSLRAGKFAQLLELFVRSLEQDSDVAGIFDNLSNGNVRVAIDLLREILSSPHIDYDSILAESAADLHFRLEYRQVLRALIYTEYSYYFPGGHVSNVFDLSFALEGDHFALCVLLSGLIAWEDTTLTGGFVSTNDIYSQMQSSHFLIQQIDAALRVGLQNGLIETVGRHLEIVDTTVPHGFRVTAKGAYHAQRLVREYSYYDAIVVDTPILDAKIRETIKDVSGEAHLERCERFVNYLEACWTAASLEPEPFSFSDVAREVRSQVNAMRAAIARRKWTES